MAAEVRIIVSGTDSASGVLAKVRQEVAGVGQEAQQQSGGVKGFFGGIAQVAGGILTSNIIGGLTSQFAGMFTGGLEDAKNTNLLMAQTAQVIKTTGGAAGLSATQISDMAAAMSDAAGLSLFGDDEIQASQNMLLTFTNIGKDVFPAATQATVDMAQALHKTPEAMSMMIGKALNSAEGFGALKKSGVAFTDAQEEMIKTLFATGDASAAAKIILGELNTEFGGQAAAAAAAAGPLVQFKAILGETAESVMASLLPAIGMLGALLVSPGVQGAITSVAEALSTGIGTAISWVTTTGVPMLVGAWQTIEPVFAKVVDTVQMVVEAFGEGGIGAAIDTLIYNVTGLDLGFGALVEGGIAYVIAAIPNVISAFQQVSVFVSDNIGPIMYGLAAVFLVVVVPAFVAWAIAAGAAAIATIAALAPVLIPIAAIGVAVALLKAAWDSDFGGIKTTLTAFWESTGKPIFTAIQTWLATTLSAAVRGLAVVWTTVLLPAIQGIASFWTGTLQPALAAFWSFLQGSVIPIISALANQHFAALKTAAQGVATFWTGTLQPAFAAVSSFLSSTATSAVAGFQVVLGGIEDAFNFVASAVNGVIKVIHDLVDFWNSIKPPDWIKMASPPPLARAFTYVADSIRDASSALPVLKTQMELIPAAGLAGAGAASSATTTNTSMRANVVINAQANQNPYQVARKTIEAINKSMNLRRA